MSARANSSRSRSLASRRTATCGNGLGYSSIAEVRQGKFFDIALAGGVTREQAQKDVEAIAHEVLANPVIEEYRVELLEG